MYIKIDNTTDMSAFKVKHYILNIFIFSLSSKFLLKFYIYEHYFY